jgi:hypothetical protein
MTRFATLGTLLSVHVPDNGETPSAIKHKSHFPLRCALISDLVFDPIKNFHNSLSRYLTISST